MQWLTQQIFPLCQVSLRRVTPLRSHHSDTVIGKKPVSQCSLIPPPSSRGARGRAVQAGGRQATTTAKPNTWAGGRAGEGRQHQQYYDWISGVRSQRITGWFIDCFYLLEGWLEGEERVRTEEIWQKDRDKQTKNGIWFASGGVEFPTNYKLMGDGGRKKRNYKLIGNYNTDLLDCR